MFEGSGAMLLPLLSNIWSGTCGNVFPAPTTPSHQLQPHTGPCLVTSPSSWAMETEKEFAPGTGPIWEVHLAGRRDMVTEGHGDMSRPSARRHCCRVTVSSCVGWNAHIPSREVGSSPSSSTSYTTSWVRWGAAEGGWFRCLGPYHPHGSPRCGF